MKLRLLQNHLAGAFGLLAFAVGSTSALADTNVVCAIGDPSNCFAGGHFPPAITQPFSLNQDEAAAVRYIDGQWSIHGNVLGSFGFNAWTPVVGDWDGDGYDNPGYYKNGVWVLKNSWDFSISTDVYAYQYGDNTWLPVPGDWNGDGKDSLGLYKDGTFKVRDIINDPAGEKIISFGYLPYNEADPLGTKPVAGEFLGSKTMIGVFENTRGKIVVPKQSETFEPGVPNANLHYGAVAVRNPNQVPVVFDGQHTLANPSHPKSVMVFSEAPMASYLDMCPSWTGCLWLTLGPQNPNENGGTEVPDPVVW